MRGRRDGRGLVAAAGGTAGPGRSSRRRAEQHQPRIPHWCEGRRRVRRARASLQTRGQAAVTVSGGRAWPGNTRTPRPIGGHREACGTWRRRRDARRRARRARAGFEIDHSEPSGSRVAISRAAGPDGARNTSGATSNTTQEQTESERAGYAAAGDQAGPQAQPEIRQRPKHQRRNKRRHRKRKPYSPRNALIAGISRTACTRPAR